MTELVKTNTFHLFLADWSGNNNHILSKFELTNKEITRMSDTDFIKNLNKSLDTQLSTLQRHAILIISRHSNDINMIKFVTMIGLLVEISSNDVFDYIDQILLVKNDSRIEELSGGNRVLNAIKLTVVLSAIVGKHIAVVYLNRGLEYKVKNSNTMVVISDMFAASQECTLPELPPSISYLKQTGLITEQQARFYQVMYATDKAAIGACSPIPKYIESMIFEGGPEPTVLESPERSEYIGALVPQSYMMYIGETEVSSATKELELIEKSRTHGTELELYEKIVNSMEPIKFEERVSKSKSQSKTIKITKPVTVYDVLESGYGSLKGLIHVYTTEIAVHGRLNPSPVTDTWNDIKFAAKNKIAYYKFLIDKGFITVERAHQDLESWFHHACLLFTLSCATIVVDVNLLIWIYKKLRKFSKANSKYQLTEIESERKTNDLIANRESKSQIKSLTAISHNEEKRRKDASEALLDLSKNTGGKTKRRKQRKNKTRKK